MDIFYIYINNLNKKAKDRHSQHHELGRYIVDYVAKNVYKIQNSEIEIIKDKPQFKYSKLQFSISHSKNIVLVAFDNMPVGIDIEYIKGRDYKAIAERMQFRLKADNLKEFYRFWTQYEAEYKLGNKAISIISKEIFNEYMLCVASCKENIELNFNRIEL